MRAFCNSRSDFHIEKTDIWITLQVAINDIDANSDSYITMKMVLKRFLFDEATSVMGHESRRWTL